MPNTFIEIDEDTFENNYPLMANPFDSNASWTHRDGGGCLFETYGREFAFVREQDPRCVWTIVEGDEGNTHVYSGFRVVNRMGYLISTVPIPEGFDIHVRIRT